ncbi:hypothetical protein EST38_g11545 [Candolleomyces aberdarensis]|uniref:TOG domain-containing protein n=1 Tax=Candolleomyces aberdarensis TaxID=2316362 RepID=A0A4Q2D588_9AGAR|nr:hypothetical protein EST38_g11545 [Candolleomyces aberdarensis]
MSAKDSIDLVAEKYRADISLPETEDYWEKITKGFIALKTCCQDGAFSSTTEVVKIIKSFHSALTHSLLSERTRLCLAALDLIESVASACDSDFEPLLPQFFPTLMTLTGRTNKLVINRTKSCLLQLVESTHSPSVLPHFASYLQEKSATMRLISAECALAYMKCCNPPDLEKESRAVEIENILRKTARDANADVRKVGRDIFGAYKILLPDRVDRFTAPLTPTMRKYLDIKSTASQPVASSALSRVKSMSALSTAAQEGKRPVAKHSRTNSVATSKAPERNPPAPQPVVRPASSMAATRPTRPQEAAKPAVRPESSRQALTASSKSTTGPSRVLSSSVAASKQPIGRARPAPAAPQRTLSRPALASSTSTTLASSGPRRVPLPDSSQSTGPALMQKKPLSRPASQQSNVATDAVGRPNSQQSRPIRPTSKPTSAPKPGSSTQASRAMPPPKTKADGSALGEPSKASRPVKRLGEAAEPAKRAANLGDSSKTSRPVKRVPEASTGAKETAEPAKRPARTQGGLMQPTASQLAKVKALVIQKAAKKPAAVPAKPSSRPNPATASTNVLNKSTKANIARAGESTKTAKTTKASPPVVPEAVPLPPSPKVEANTLPEAVEAVAATVEENEAPIEEDSEPAEEEEVEEEEAVVSEPEDEVVQEVEYPAPAAIGLVVTDSDKEPFELPNTPLNPEIKSLGWNIQNAKTPISQLLTSIQQGFEYSPASPLSPPQSYLTGNNGETQPLSFPLF